ncbi:chemotaxis protein CheA [Pelagibaculum spongiae]|uniref:Chemotaxis protein CheA n=1 Tax=Pelagibaculum spongiae TaxID=2080658 RepID=A0A2V1GTU8_9GAMM|nr:chemotaxis protein CheA [Pelagibaculum spongiae]PVZ66691.1 chemotaxis protein CheA [Pelagibaculum spongiae]
MTLDVDQEILQDFLVEAGEILELLSEQLVTLEQTPKDSDLLNAIFRGFHTVKGGAGFLSLDPLVEVCHAAENIFDRLRNHEIEVSPGLMDHVLKGLDSVIDMFDEIRNDEPPTPADAVQLQALQAWAEGKQEQLVAPVNQQAVIANAEAQAAADISDEEFAELMTQMNGPQASAPQDPVSAPHVASSIEAAPVVSQPAADPISFGRTLDEDITEDEFEALLDQLHGVGQHGGMPAVEAVPETVEPEVPPAPVISPLSLANDSDEITEDEFEALLDQLHGSGAPGRQDNVAPDVNDDVASNAQDNIAPEIINTVKAQAAPVAKAPQPAAKPALATPVAAPEKAAKKTEKAKGDVTVRVDTSRLDDIMNLVGELVLVRNRLTTLGAAGGDEELSKAVQNLDLVTSDLQGAVMKTRMQPIKKVFGRFPRVVRDLARNLNKEVSLTMEGEETDLDKNLVEALADPLVHLVRNAVDHGVEDPETREKNGKSRIGKVVLKAAQAGDHIQLSISDDGAGMDPDKLRLKAVEKQLMDSEAAARLTNRECFNLIFAPGFSTAQQVSDVSGRGVGMDVVKTRIAQLNGSVDIDSTLGAGTKIIIKLPLTLAIMPTLMVMLGGQPFALPLGSVKEIFHLDLNKTSNVDGQLTVVVRGQTLPLFYIDQWLVPVERREKKDKKEGQVVIVSVGTQWVGFVVDQLLGQEEVVIKPLGNHLHGTPGMAGATITSDGRIALILDIPGLIKQYARRNAMIRSL